MKLRVLLNEILSEEELNFSDLSKIDDIIGAELEKATEEEDSVNEVVGITTAAFVLALPGIINGIARIIQAIKEKAPKKFNLNKGTPPPLEYIIKFTDKIDGYLDAPFRTILKPFIKDTVKRDKVAKFFKALTLIIMSLGTDITKSPDLLSLGKNFAGQYWYDLLTSKTTADLITKTKEIIPKLLA